MLDMLLMYFLGFTQMRQLVCLLTLPANLDYSWIKTSKDPWFGCLAEPFPNTREFTPVELFLPWHLVCWQRRFKISLLPSTLDLGFDVTYSNYILTSQNLFVLLEESVEWDRSRWGWHLWLCHLLACLLIIFVDLVLYLAFTFVNEIHCATHFWWMSLRGAKMDIDDNQQQAFWFGHKFRTSLACGQASNWNNVDYQYYDSDLVECGWQILHTHVPSHEKNKVLTGIRSIINI